MSETLASLETVNLTENNKITASDSEGKAGDDDENDDEGSQQYTESGREAATRAHLPWGQRATENLRSSRRTIRGQERRRRGGDTRVRCNSHKDAITRMLY